MATNPAPSSQKTNTVMKKKEQFPMNEMDHKFSKIIIRPLQLFTSEETVGYVNRWQCADACNFFAVT